MSKSIAFESLRPLCVVLMKEQTLESIQAVARSIQDLDTESLQALQQYVLFPLRILLKNQSKLSTGVCEAGVLCMQSILEKTTLVNWEMFSDIFTALCITISSKQSNGQASDGSEEFKLAVVKALTAMQKSADPAIILQLMSPQSLPMLGHCISLLLNLSEAEKMKELQVAALKCLTSFVPDDDESMVYGEASKCFASFLPGLSVTISRVILASPKQGQNVTSNAIECWSKHISMVMDDRFLPLDKTQKSDDLTKRQHLQDGEESLLVSKTETWLTGTASKLDILITKIVTMVTSRSWRVRLALVRFAETLIIRTKSSMSCSMGKVLEVLVSLAQDRYDQVSSPSQAILRSMAKESLTVESRMLSELLEDNLHKLVTVLPRIIRTADDEEKLSTVTAMVGYVKLLGHRLNSLLNSAPHLKRLSIALLQALELSIRDTGILETTTAPQTDLSGGEVRRGHSRDFKHFSDHKIYEGIFQLCQLLGKYGNVPLLIDNFLSYFHESPTYVKQAAMIMNEIMQGTLLVANDDQLSIWQEKEKQEEEEERIEDALKDAEELKSIVGMLLDEYLSPSCWDVPTTQSSPPSTAPLSSASSSSLSWQLSAPTHLILRNASSSSSSKDLLTVSQMNHNTLLKCLLLDGIAVFAQVLGAQFNQLLMHCLYLVLERMADERTLVCQHAKATLAIISQACGYRSISELLLMNVDYLSDSVSARLRHYEWNLKAPLVLKVTLQHSTFDILPLLQDTIEEVFHLMDDHHGVHATSLMSVLQSLVLAINRWFPVSREEEECTEVLSCESDQVSSIVAFCNDYIQTLNKADEDLKNLDLEMDPENTNEDEDEEKWMEEADTPKELPLHIKNVKQVLEHCINLMSSSNPRLRLQVLSTVQSAVEALHENQDVLLPLVHKLWPAFVLRFSDQEILVTCKAFETLLTLAESSRDFIRRRVVKDIWPKLTSFVQTHAAMSEKAGSSYHHTAYYKLQHSILAGIGQLCLQVDICEADLLVMVQACIPYLNACQPVGLQEACISAFEGFIAAEPDAVWFSLLDISSSSSLQPTHPCFPSIKFAVDSSKQNTQQWSNIEKLLR